MAKRGLGSPNISLEKKREIQSKGGRTSKRGPQQYNSDIRGFKRVEETDQDKEAEEMNTIEDNGWF